jgi:hypothetical protein
MAVKCPRRELDTPVGDSFYDLIRSPQHRRRDRQAEGLGGHHAATVVCWLRTAPIFRQASILRNLIWPLPLTPRE